MRVVLHGSLRERYGDEFNIATTVPADAIEGLSRQLPEWPRDLVISVPGFETEEALRSVTDEDTIHLMPAMFGGGGVAKVIIGVALIAAGVITAVLAPGMPWYSMMLISMGASMLIGGISELMMKAPTNDKTGDPPASKYFSANKNTVAIGTPIIMAWGRIKLAGHWLSIQVDSSDLVTTSFPTTTS